MTNESRMNQLTRQLTRLLLLFPAYTDHYNWIKGLTRDTEEWVAWRVIMLIVVIFLTFGFVLVMSLVCCIFKTYVYHRIAAVAFGLWLLAGMSLFFKVLLQHQYYFNITI